MRKAQILQGSSILLSVFSVFVVQHSFISNYSSYLLAFLIIFSAIYISIGRRHVMGSTFGVKRSKPGSELFTSSPVEIFGIISIILLIIVLTNGLASPLFFFIYFILFLLAFMSESSTIWIFLVSIILFFIPEASRSFNYDTVIKMLSLLLISPIAFFVARELERRQLLNNRIESKTDEIIQEAENLRDSTLPSEPDKIEAIDEIIEEASSLQSDAEK